MPHEPNHRFHTIKPIFVLIILLLEIAGESDAQIRETAFGVVRSISTPGAFGCLKQYSEDGRTAPDFLLWNAGSRDLYRVRTDSLFDSLTTEHFTLPIPFDDVLLADVNHDSKLELVFVSKTEHVISIVPKLAGDTLSVVQTIRLPGTPTGWTIGDINGDGNADILIFDRNNPGIIPLLGDRKGTFHIGRTIGPDLAAGSIALTNLNNDNLTDIVVYDWVKSELHLLYGVGHGRFLDQSTFRVQGDVSGIIPMRLDPVSYLDLVLVEKHPAEVQDWQGNGIGDFHLAKQAVLGDTVTAAVLGDVNGDGLVDFGYLTHTPSLQILMNTGEDWSQDHIQFWAGKDPASVILRDFNRDNRVDAVVLDKRGERLRFFFNSGEENVLTDSLEFAAAPSPMGLVIHRIGTDVAGDLAVVNFLGRSLSLFPNRGPAGLSGQTTFSLSINPQCLTYHSSTDSSARFVVTSSAADTLLLFSLNLKDSSSSYAIIPTEGSAQVVHTGINRFGQADFLTINTFTSGQNPDIHYYERLDPGTFIEQTFRLNKPDRLLGATAEYLNGDQYPDLIYVYHSADSGGVNLSVSFGDSLMTYAQRHSTVELPRRDTVSCYLWTGLFGRADTADLLIYFGDPLYTLERAPGQGNGQFGEPEPLLDRVKLTNRSMLQIVDADSDGYPDIIINNAKEGMLGWLRGNPHGAFAPWQPLVGIKPHEFFAIGDLNGDGIADIAIARSEKGTIAIYNGTIEFTKVNHAAGR